MSSVTHNPERSTRLPAAMAVVAAVLLTIGLISPAAAAPPKNPNQSAASWLASQVNADGALEGFTPGVADYGTTLQGIIGLAAAGAEGPTAQRMLDAVNGDIDAAVAPFGDDDPGRLSLAILANVALGEDPTDVGGVDLVTRLQATRRAAAPDIGLYGAGDPTYDGAFRQGLSLLALASVDIDDAAGEAWLTDQQCNTGSWVAYRPDTAVPCPAVDAASFSGPDTNSTALALLGLTAQDVTPDHDAQAWLTGVRTASGGWPYFGDASEPADASSSALVLTALRTATGTTDTDGLAALRTFQIPCEAEDPADIGGLFFQAQGDGSELPDNFSTAQGLWGLSEVEFPVIDAELADPVAPDCTVPPTTPTTPSTTPGSTAAVVPPTSAVTPTSDVTIPAESTTPPPSGDEAPSDVAVPVSGPAAEAVPTPPAAPYAAAAPAQPIQTVTATPTSTSFLANTGASPNLVLLAAAAMLGIGAAALLVRRRIGMR